MSKILELLSYNKKREGVKKENAGERSAYLAPGDFDSSTKEKLANTYIFNPTGAYDDPAKKKEKHILPSKHNAASPKIRMGQLFPWLIAFLAIILLLVNMVYQGRINITVQFMEEGAVRTAPDADRAIAPGNESAPEAEAYERAPTHTPLIADGHLNNLVIASIGFY